MIKFPHVQGPCAEYAWFWSSSYGAVSSNVQAHVHTSVCMDIQMYGHTEVSTISPLGHVGLSGIKCLQLQGDITTGLRSPDNLEAGNVFTLLRPVEM